LGADVLPFAANRLTADLMKRVDLLVFLGPSRTVDFEFHLTDWFRSTKRPTDLPVLPEIEKLRGVRMLAFYGDDETDSLGPMLDPSLAKVIRLKGGHRIGGNYSPVLADILTAIRE
jgi:type IV secretory pathway VirJ component